MTTASAASHTGQMARVAQTGSAAGIRDLFRAAKERFFYHRALAALETLNRDELAALDISRFALPSIAREIVRAR